MVSQSPKESAEERPGESPDAAGAGAADSERAPGPAAAEGAERFRRIEQALVRCEGQVQGLGQRVADLEAAYRAARKRALYFRLGLLLLLLAAYVLVRARYAG